MLNYRANSLGLASKFNISTILPKAYDRDLSEFGTNAHIYWSLYSPNERFRKRWLPKATEPNLAAEKINKFREQGGKVVLHNAFIKDQNDTPEQLDQLIDFIRNNGLQDLDYNIVAYNPFSAAHGVETEKTSEIFEKLSGVMTGRVQVIDRVGRDVSASCGTFFK